MEVAVNEMAASQSEAELEFEPMVVNTAAWGG
jgi:hypothetical protein